MVSLSLCLPSSIYLQAKDLKFESVRKAISRLDLTTTSPLIKSSLLLKACIRSGNLELGKLLHHKLIDSGLPLDSVLLNSLITSTPNAGIGRTHFQYSATWAIIRETWSPGLLSSPVSPIIPWSPEPFSPFFTCSNAQGISFIPMNIALRPYFDLVLILYSLLLALQSLPFS